MASETKAKRSVDKNIFIEEYCANGGNGVQAIIIAGFSGTYKAARVAAHRLLTNANIKETIESRRAEIHGEMQTEYGLTRKRQCEKLQRIADKAEREGKYTSAVAALRVQSKICGLFAEDNRQKSLGSLGEALAAMVKSRANKALPGSSRKAIEARVRPSGIGVSQASIEVIEN